MALIPGELQDLAQIAASLKLGVLYLGTEKNRRANMAFSSPMQQAIIALLISPKGYKTPKHISLWQPYIEALLTEELLIPRQCYKVCQQSGISHL